jgi:predicted metal-dependent hydrolase
MPRERSANANPATGAARQLSLFDDLPGGQRAPTAPLPPPLVAGVVSAPPQTPASPQAPIVEAAGRPAVMPATPHFDHPQADRSVLLNGHRVAFAFRRARRRSIGFVIGPEGLSVAAPKWVGISEVEAALTEKAGWILRKLHEQHERARRLDQARVDWRDGVSIPFLGEPVIVVIDPRSTGAVLNSAAQALPGVPRLTLHVGLPHGAAAEQLRDAVQSWLQRQARRVFEERCAVFAQRLEVRITRLSLSSASTRWGSASADGSIRLNWRLVHFALPVIDYVVAHELAHLREMNHSDAFWDVVRSVLPDYASARSALKTEMLPVLG